MNNDPIPPGLLRREPSNEPPPPGKPGFLPQLCWTLIFALVLALGLFVMRHGCLPGTKKPLFASAETPAPSKGAGASRDVSPVSTPVGPGDPLIRTAPLPAIWAPQACGALLLESPVVLTPIALPPEIPENLTQPSDSNRCWQGKLNQQMVVSVWISRSNGAHFPSLDDGDRLAETLLHHSGSKDASLTANPQPLWVNGYVARRSSATTRDEHGAVYNETLTIQRGRELFILVISCGDETRANATRILKSVQIRGGASR